MWLWSGRHEQKLIFIPIIENGMSFVFGCLNFFLLDFR